MSRTVRLYDEPCHPGHRQVRVPRKPGVNCMPREWAVIVAHLLEKTHVVDDGRPVATEDMRDDSGQVVHDPMFAVAEATHE